MTRLTIGTFFLCTALLCPVSSFAQSIARPTITQIRGGFFIEWVSPIEIAAVQLDKNMAGTLEVMFDVPSVDFIKNTIDTRQSPTASPEMITALADYWIVRGKPERAIPLYEATLKQGNLDDQRELVFMNNLAMLYSQVHGNHEKAIEIVDSALETRKDNVILLDTKGLILLNSGDPKAAVEPLTRAVELSCQLPVYCLHLAQALHLDGRDSQARRYFDPVRNQLIAAVPNMAKENKAMFDSLQRALPPINAQ